MKLFLILVSILMPMYTYGQFFHGAALHYDGQQVYTDFQVDKLIEKLESDSVKVREVKVIECEDTEVDTVKKCTIHVKGGYPVLTNEPGQPHVFFELMEPYPH